MENTRVVSDDIKYYFGRRRGFWAAFDHVPL